MEIIILHDKEILSEPQFAAISCAVCANCLNEPYRVGFKKTLSNDAKRCILVQIAKWM